MGATLTAIFVTVVMIVVGLAMFMSIRQAYKQGYADGQLNASMAHTRLLMQQLAAKEGE